MHYDFHFFPSGKAKDTCSWEPQQYNGAGKAFCPLPLYELSIFFSLSEPTGTAAYYTLPVGGAIQVALSNASRLSYPAAIETLCEGDRYIWVWSAARFF